MTVRYGSGGIITNIYNTYKTFDKHIIGKYSSITPNNSNYKSISLNNIYKWNDMEGYYSLITKDKQYHWIELSFQKPFILSAYRIAIITNYRFAKSWKIETKFKDSSYKTIHESNELICPSIVSNCNSEFFSEKIFYIDKENRTLCDTIKITNTGKDTCGTYVLSIGALELYEEPSFCRPISNTKTIFRQLLFTLLHRKN